MWMQHRPGAPTCGRGKKSIPEAEVLGPSQDGFTTKIHLRAEGGGKLMTCLLTGGERHELTVAEHLMEQGKVKGSGPRRPRCRPKRVLGDKGYSSKTFRRFLRQLGIRYTIARKVNEPPRCSFDNAVYRQRNRIELLINRLKQFRRIAIRYEKRATNYEAILTLASILLWLSFANKP
jgi:transposase